MFCTMVMTFQSQLSLCFEVEDAIETNLIYVSFIYFFLLQLPWCFEVILYFSVIVSLSTIPFLTPKEKDI